MAGLRELSLLGDGVFSSRILGSRRKGFGCFSQDGLQPLN